MAALHPYACKQQRGVDTGGVRPHPSHITGPFAFRNGRRQIIFLNEGPTGSAVIPELLQQRSIRRVGDNGDPHASDCAGPC